MKNILRIFLILSFLMPTVVKAETGWLKKRRKGYLYFKPYVTVKSSDVIVIFITPEGKIYRGTCRNKKFTDICTITPGKYFDSPYTLLRYIILKISPPNASKIVNTGIISNSVKED